MSSDTLTVTSRAFYERSKAKVAISIIVAASSLMLLGFCAVAGGNSASSNGKKIVPLIFLRWLLFCSSVNNFCSVCFFDMVSILFNCVFCAEIYNSKSVKYDDHVQNASKALAGGYGE